MTVKTTTLVDRLLLAVTSPLNAFKDAEADVSYNSKDVAQTALFAAGIGGFLGHKYGHKLVKMIGGND